MARSFTAQAINATQPSSNGGDTTVSIATKVNARMVEILALFDLIVPNASHIIPGDPSANQVLQAVNANTLGWVSILNLIKLGEASTAYSANDLVINANKLYIVNTGYTSPDPFDPDDTELTLVSGLTAAENVANTLNHTRFTTDYADSAPTRTYTVTDGKRYFIDALPGGITAESLILPDLSGSVTAFEFTVLPRGRQFSAVPLTFTRNGSDSSAQFFTMVDPTSAISDDITVNTNGMYQLFGRREGGQTKWTVVKTDNN